MEEPNKNLGGRPSKFTEELVTSVETYIRGWTVGEVSVIPTLEGLALSLHVAKKTLLAWEKDEGLDPILRERFCNAMDEVRSRQLDLLITNGLKGTFNSTITKLMMGNHGYREKSDVTTDEKPLPTPQSVIVTSEAVQEGVKAFEEALRPKRK